MAFITSAITVYMRDMEHILGIIVMAWQYLTPIMYDAAIIPERLQPIFNLNPMTPVIKAYRDILYYGKIPEWTTLLSALVMGIVVLIVGWFVFTKMKRRFAEEL